jgi:hypothetical protein
MLIVPVGATAITTYPQAIALPVVTNAVSCAYELATRKQDKLPKKESKPTTVRSKIKQRITGSIKPIKRAVASYLIAYSIMGAAAFGHYNACSMLEPGTIPERETVNLTFRRCEKDDRSLFLVGEIHQYNRSSIKALFNFMDHNKITRVLSEGVGSEGISTSEMSLPIRFFVAVGQAPINGVQGPEPPKAQYIPSDGNREVHEEYLERLDSSGRIEGMSRTGDVELIMTGTIGSLFAPTFYFLGVYMRSFGTFQIADAVNIGGSELVDARNVSMTRNAVQHFNEHPEDTSMVKVGYAHIDGMIELLEEDGFTCSKLP